MKTSFTTGMSGLLAAKIIRRWMSTLDYRGYFYEPGLDPVEGTGGPRIYIFWHEHILFPLYLRGRNHLSMLLSQHRDADILAQIAFLLGFGTVRGSSYRGGTAALLQLMREAQHHHLTLTPDGPRGPRRKMAPGPLYLASKLGLPVVPLGFGYNHPWRLRSWDQFAVPKPFSRARCVAGPEITLPRNIGRDLLEQYGHQLEHLLTALTDEAEEWATSGRRREGEKLIRQQPGPRPTNLRVYPEQIAAREARRAA
jgi:lysophospholipid acyltransferase (LPLAT)-like uncharacterized protein